jgi:hypothetical protein
LDLCIDLLGTDISSYKEHLKKISKITLIDIISCIYAVESIVRQPTDAMVIFHQHPPLTVRQEGNNVRVTTGRLDFLFPDSEAQDIGETYNRLALESEGHFTLRWESLPGADVAPSTFDEIVQEVTLNWMYIRATNHQPLQISEAEWEHPQTRRIIQSAVKRNLQPGSRIETQLCALLMGLSEAEYLNWHEADNTFLGIM